MSNAREIANVERAKAVAAVREWDLVIKALDNAGPTGVHAGEFGKPAKRKANGSAAARTLPLPTPKAKTKRSRLTVARMRIAAAKRNKKEPRSEDLALVASAEAVPAEQAAE